MTYATWPADLPQFVQESGYSESMPDQTVESSVDSGPPKVRRRFTKAFRPITAQIWCDTDQLATFERFHRVTLSGGTLPFLWVNPITQSAVVFRFRKPAPSHSPFGGGNVAIKFALHQMITLASLRFDVDTFSFDETDHSFDEASY